MSLKTTRKGQSFESQGKGMTAVSRLPIGLSFERILIPFTGVTLAEMTEVRLVANGETIRTFRSAAKLETQNRFDGMAATNGILVLNLVRHGLRTRAGEELTKIGTGAPRNNNAGSPAYNPNPITTFAVEIDVDAGATNPPVFGVPKLHQDLPAPTGAIVKSKQYTYSPTGAGVFEIADLPKGELINRVFFYTPNNKIDSLEVERDNFVSFSRSTAENQLLQSEGQRVPQTGLWVYDPTENGNGSEGLPTANVHDLRFRLEMSAAETVEVVVETLSLLKV